MSFTNGQLAQKIADLISYWSDFNKEYSDWQGGAVDGGPSSDGQYPLTDWYGNELLVKSPAKLQDDVDNITTGATAQANAAAASAAAAAASESNASTSAATATAQAALADADRVAAELAETNATNAQVTAVAQANLATDRAGYAQEWANLPYNTLVSAAAGGDEVDDYSARHWAEHAASLNPGASPQLYARTDIAEQFDGVVTFAANPVINVGANALSSLTIGEPTTLRGNSQDAGINLYGEHSGIIYGARIQVISSNMQFTGVGANQVGNLQLDFDLQFLNSHSISGVNNITASGAVTGANLNVSNWDTAYGWGDHSTQNYAVTTGDTFTGDINISGVSIKGEANSGDANADMFSAYGGLSIHRLASNAANIPSSSNNANAILAIGTHEGTGVGYGHQLYFNSNNEINHRVASNGVWGSWYKLWTSQNFTDNSANWNTAYGWGNHASAGYMTDLVNDTTPQLGGNLSVNGKYITETNHGRTGGQSLWGDGTTTEADWSALPAGAHQFARNTVQYAPVANYGYYTKVAQRDSGGVGWGGLWVGYSNAENYIGRSTTGPITWERIITDYSTEFSNWNTAYGWGNHASAGYAPTASPTFTGTISGGTFDVGSVVISPQFRLDAASGNGISFWNSASAGTYGIYMSLATDGTWGGRVYGETTSDYNIYFEMNSGTNRGFVFETDNNKLFSINPSGVYADVPQFLISQANGEGDVRLIIEADRNNVGVETDQAELWLAQDGRGVLGYFRTTDSNQLEIGSSATTIGTFTTPVMSWAYNSNAVSMPGSLTVTGNIAAGNIPAYNSFTGGAIVTRHSSGYIFSNYFNQSIGSATSSVESHVPVCTNSDGYFRWKTAANFWKWHSPLHAEELTSSVNLNNLLAANAGFYYQTANADTTGNNYPNAQAGSLLVQKSAGSATQLYITYPTSANKMFFRSYYGSAWGSWNEVITADETQTLSGAKTFSSNPKRSSQGGYLHHNSSSYTDGGITFSTSAASGGTSGDIWFKYT